nr:reverse transcriptase [Tanacetum cinerariifolium]
MIKPVLHVKRESSTELLDEASGILKSFIIGIENLVDHKVKVIRCDNGTEFKNREMNLFCSGPDWLFDIDELTRIMNYKPIVAGTQSNGFAGTKASDKLVDEDLRKESECKDKEKEDNVNSTNNVNTFNAAGSNEGNVDGGIISSELPFDPNMPALEDIEEEVYVCQPLGFEDPDIPDRVYKVEKALCGLHQDPRA